MTACASRAEEVCSDRGFVVLSGRSSRRVYGPEGQQVAAERAELVVHCGEGAQDGGGPSSHEHPWTLEHPQEDAPPPVPSPVCVPGSTQRCFGPGACEGGQTCAADGAGFEACDCGKRPEPVAPMTPSESESQSPGAAPASDAAVK